MQDDLQTPLHYYTNPACRFGSSFYYSLRSVTAAEQKTIILLRAYFHTIRNITRHCQDPGVARLKLHWWAEEVDQLQQKKARHPLTQALQCIDVPITITTEEYLTPILASLNRLTPSSSLTETDIDQMADADEGLFCQLLTRTLGQENLEASLISGRWLYRFYALRHLRFHLQQGHLPFCTTRDVNEFMTRETLPKDFLQDYTNKLHHTYLTMWTSSHPLNILLRLRRNLLHLIAQEAFPLLTYDLHLPGWKKLILAWFG